jgi:hypothetical protein
VCAANHPTPVTSLSEGRTVICLMRLIRVGEQLTRQLRHQPNPSNMTGAHAVLRWKKLRIVILRFGTW